MNTSPGCTNDSRSCFLGGRTVDKTEEKIDELTRVMLAKPIVPVVLATNCYTKEFFGDLDMLGSARGVYREVGIGERISLSRVWDNIYHTYVFEFRTQSAVDKGARTLVVKTKYYGKTLQDTKDVEIPEHVTAEEPTGCSGCETAKSSSPTPSLWLMLLCLTCLRLTGRISRGVHFSHWTDAR